MGKHSPVVIAPAYMESFQCIGSSCEETCCKGWAITIDKQTYKKYRTIEIRELRDKIKTSVVLTEDASNADNYAKIKLEEDGSCSFLDDKKLCGIQSKLGASYLSKTCHIYPRTLTRKNDEVSLYASLSCPEVARKALLDVEAMRMTHITLPYPNENAVPLTSSMRYNENHSDMLIALSSYIVDTSSFVLRFPSYRSGEAMIVLGLMVQKLSQFLNEPDAESAKTSIIERLIQFTDANFLTKAGEFAQGITIDRSKQIILLRGVLRTYFSKHQPHSSFKQVMLDMMAGIQFDDNDIAATEKRYCEADSKWFKPFDEAHPHLLKNYLLNDLGKNNFPIGKMRGLETEFIDLAVRYSLIKMILVGIAAFKKDSFNELDYVTVIYTFSRNIEHNLKFMPELLELLAEDGLSNIAAATLMMR